ncbi:MAG: hypothetical protein ABIP75_04965 [Pyrinomonadaceae bacterium]
MFMKKVCLLILIWGMALGISCSKAMRDTPAGPATASEDTGDRKYSDRWGPPQRIATLADQTITESSGLVASPRNPGLFWTHNDSGAGPILYALDRTGKSAGVWQVAGAAAKDWEDIAAGPGPDRGTSYLYVGDIGDNSLARLQVAVYRVPEPAITPTDAESTAAAPRILEGAVAIELKYPDGSHNAEALMVHPKTGDLYIVTKERRRPAGVYKLPAAYLVQPGVQTLTRVTELKMPSVVEGMVTGGDISPDGKHLILCDYFGAYELTLANGEFDAIWKETPLIVDLGAREIGESICYSLDGRSLFATSENLPTPLIEANAK